jgi:pimeloyl-ACP methyl ester carboxylesterase
MTFLLVHAGGFAGSCWDEILPFLDGPALAVDLPGRGRTPGDLATIGVVDFVDSVVREMVGRDLRDVTLAGHSLAGITLPGVAERVPDRLRRLVFMSCAVPPHGTSVSDVLGGFSPNAALIAARLGDALVGPGGALHPELATALFCNDMDEGQTRSTLDRMVPEPANVLAEPADLTGLRHPIARTWIRPALDAIVGPETQDRMVETLGGADVVELGAAHMAMISRPQEPARILNQL